MEKHFRCGNGNPLAGRSVRARFVILWIVIPILRCIEVELDRRRRSVFDGRLEFRARGALKPEQPAEADARNENEAGDQGT